MQAGLTTRCLTFKNIFVGTPTSLLDAMAFDGTRRQTDTSIQMPLAAYQHLMAEAPVGMSKSEVSREFVEASSKFAETRRPADASLALR